MQRTNLILIMTLSLLSSCKHKETDSEVYKRNIRTAIESLTKNVDSYTRTSGIQKTIFIIDTTDIKFKNLVRLDKTKINRILNGKMIMESQFTHKIDTFKSELYLFDDLTSIFKDTTYIILQKEHVILPNSRLYLVQMKKDKTLIKLLAAHENQFCMSSMTTSALLGDSMIFTQEASHSISDAGISKGKTYVIKTSKIKKYILKDNSYISLDSSSTTGFE